MYAGLNLLRDEAQHTLLAIDHSCLAIIALTAGAELHFDNIKRVHRQASPTFSHPFGDLLLTTWMGSDSVQPFLSIQRADWPFLALEFLNCNSPRDCLVPGPRALPSKKIQHLQVTGMRSRVLGDRSPPSRSGFPSAPGFRFCSHEAPRAIHLLHSDLERAADQRNLQLGSYAHGCPLPCICCELSLCSYCSIVGYGCASHLKQQFSLPCIPQPR